MSSPHKEVQKQEMTYLNAALLLKCLAFPDLERVLWLVASHSHLRVSYLVITKAVVGLRGVEEDRVKR